MIARQQTAMLTSFNEADMGRIVELRRKYREHYQEKFGSKPGIMPFFVKACCEALREFPLVNASIDGSDIVYHDYYDIGIAIGADKGLVVPVLRDADRLRFREIDERIEEYVAKVKENRLTIADLEGEPSPSPTEGSTARSSPPRSSTRPERGPGDARHPGPSCGPGRPGGHPPDDVPGPLLRSPPHRRPRGGGVPQAGEGAGGGAGGTAPGGVRRETFSPPAPCGRSRREGRKGKQRRSNRDGQDNQDERRD